MPASRRVGPRSEKGKSPSTFDRSYEMAELALVIVFIADLSPLLDRLK